MGWSVPNGGEETSLDAWLSSWFRGLKLLSDNVGDLYLDVIGGVYCTRTWIQLVVSLNAFIRQYFSLIWLTASQETEICEDDRSLFTPSLCDMLPRPFHSLLGRIQQWFQSRKCRPRLMCVFRWVHRKSGQRQIGVEGIFKSLEMRAMHGARSYVQVRSLILNGY